MKKDFLNVEDIAIEFMLSKRKVRELFRNKKIPGIKIAGKYITTRDKLKSFVERNDNND